MATEEYEPTPSDELSPHRRYFSDVLHKTDSYADMLIAIDKLIESSHVGLTESETADLMQVALWQLGYNPAMSEGELRDIFTILPFLVAGPVIDKNKKIIDIREWYDSALSYLRIGMNGAHTNDCLDSPSFAFSNQCAHGSQCPLILVAKYLEEDLFDEDFSLEKYDGDALMRRQVAVEKEKLAVKFNLRTQTQADGMIDMYDRNYSMFTMGPE